MQARPLNVDDDMRPVVDFLRAQGMQDSQIVRVLVEHPPILSYSVEDRLQPFFDYLQSVGISAPGDVRPAACCAAR